MRCRLLIIAILAFQQLKCFSTAPTVLKSNQNNILHFYYHDSLGYGHPVNVRFGETKIYLNSPVLLFEADKHQTPFLIYPGEEVDIVKDGNNMATLAIKSDKVRTSELLFFKILVQQSGGIYMTLPFHPYQGKAKDLGEYNSFEKTISGTRLIRLNALDSFSKKLQTSSAFKQVVFDVVNATALKDSLLLLWNNKGLLKSQHLFEKAFDHLVAAVNAQAFSPLMPCLYAAMLPACINNNSLEFFIKSKAEYQTTLAFINANYTNLSRDFLLSKTVFASLSNNIQISDDELSTFYSSCSDKTYKNLVRIKAADLKLAGSEAQNLVLTESRTKVQLENVLSKHLGKLIYLDFWASWCSPCRAEMPSSRKLRNSFAAEDVVFIYVSSDADVQNWLKACKEEDLHTESYLMPNWAGSYWVRKYQIRSIPRYMLVGRDGKIISADAPRPGSPEILKLIKSKLKKA